MKMTTKGKYGLRAMIDLAVNDGDTQYIPLNHISARQQISEPYLERLMAKMRKADLVVTQRGTQGGYKLARSIEEISVKDILEAVDEPMNLTDCVDGEDGQCSVKRCCPSRLVWQKMSESISEVARSITLHTLIYGDRSLDDE